MFHYTLPTTLGEEKCSDRQGAYNWLICILEWSIGKICIKTGRNKNVWRKYEFSCT